MSQLCLYAVRGLRISILIILVLFVSTVASQAIEIVNPGETSAPLEATACAHALVADSGECTVGCNADCDLGTNTAQARLSLYTPTVLLSHHKAVTSTVYVDFQVAADTSGAATPLSSMVSYDVQWEGTWEVGGFFPGINDAKVEKKVWLEDRTTLKPVQSQSLGTQTANSFFGIDLASVGLGEDTGRVANSMSVNLIRGHTYRFAVSIIASGMTTNTSEFVLGYMGANEGMWWNELTVSVGQDLSTQITELTQRVDLLEKQLREHKHIYLTGRGEGHNNTEAETGPAILMDDSTVSDSELVWLPQDSTETTTLPTKSVLLTNYPNPSNPSTTIQYTLPEAGLVEIKIYNTLGRLVQTLVNEQQTAGEHSVSFDGNGLPSGVYYYRLRAGQYSETRKMTILK